MDELPDIHLRRFEIAVPEADVSVSALLLDPPEATALLVLGHGAGAGMEHPFLEGVARRLGERRVATLRYRFPYMEAGRRFPDRVPVRLATVRAAAARGAELAAERGVPLFAGGKSMGGRMTSEALAEGEVEAKVVRGVVFLGFPLHPAGKPATERAEHLASVALPMLFLQGTRDKLAGLDLLRPVVTTLGARATLHVVDGADHGFHVLKRSGRTDDDVLDELADVTAGWMAAA